jgi:hypothetical protein
MFHTKGHFGPGAEFFNGISQEETLRVRDRYRTLAHCDACGGCRPLHQKRTSKHFVLMSEMSKIMDDLPSYWRLLELGSNRMSMSRLQPIMLCWRGVL